MLGNSKALQKPTGENEHRIVRSRQRENRSPESPGSASAASAPRPASGAACPPRRRWQVSAVLGAQEERRPGPQDAQRRSNACGSVKCVISTVTAQLRRNCRQETAGYDGGGGGVDRGRGLPEDEGEHISHRLQGPSPSPCHRRALPLVLLCGRQVRGPGKGDVVRGNLLVAWNR